MVFSQGWRHFKINKAQVPHPGRPWQMRVIHSLAQLLRDPGQAGKAVPGSSPSDADEMHSRTNDRGGRETLVGNFKQFCWNFVLCLAVSLSLRQGLSKQPASPNGLKSESFITTPFFWHVWFLKHHSGHII